MREVIVTYGEENSVGKEMLHRALARHVQRLMGCACCRIMCEPHPSGECPQCQKDEGARIWSA